MEIRDRLVVRVGAFLGAEHGVIIEIHCARDVKVLIDQKPQGSTTRLKAYTAAVDPNISELGTKYTGFPSLSLKKTTAKFYTLARVAAACMLWTSLGSFQPMPC